MKIGFLLVCLLWLPEMVAGAECREGTAVGGALSEVTEKPVQADGMLFDPLEASKNPTVLSKRILQEQEKTETLLASVTDRATADAIAPKLTENTQTMKQLAQFFETIDFEHSSSFNEEEFMATAESNFEVAERVNAQFLRLMQADFFGSEALRLAVEEANAPVKGDSGVIEQPMTPEQAKAEINRMKMLEEPDSRLLATLKTIVSAESASAAVPRLNEYVGQIRKLTPPAEIIFAYFENPQAPEVLAAYKPIEEILKGIRAELLRIVKLKGFTGEGFVAFNDAMDDLFSWLCETHEHWISTVFDESFENEISSISEEQNNN